MKNDPKKYIKLKSAPFFGANQSANAAAVLMLTYDDNQKATKAHCRLAFSAQPQRFFLPLLVGLHGSTDTTARKSAIIEEKMFWKVTLPSTLIFSAKMFARLTLQFLFTYICICIAWEVFLFQTVGYVILT